MDRLSIGSSRKYQYQYSHGISIPIPLAGWSRQGEQRRGDVVKLQVLPNVDVGPRSGTPVDALMAYPDPSPASLPPPWLQAIG